MLLLSRSDAGGGSSPEELLARRPHKTCIAAAVAAGHEHRLACVCQYARIYAARDHWVREPDAGPRSRR